MLGEMFACPYNHKAFTTFAESIGQVGSSPDPNASPVSGFLSDTARKLGVSIVGGSVPELVQSRDSRSLYNTAVIYDSDGTIVEKYRKLHLFDVAIPGDPDSGRPGIYFKESDTLTAGDLGPGLTETPWGFQIGLGICYDIRFPELATALRSQSADRMKLLIYPGQFNMITGPRQWQLLGRARAVDTQSFCILASVARSNDTTDYQVRFILLLVFIFS